MSPFPAEISAKTLRRPLQRHYGDLWGPPQFTNWVDESMSWKDSCYIGDWTRVLPSLRFAGPDVLRLFADCSVNSMNNFAIEQSKHVIHCNQDGKIIEEGILTRTGEQEVICYSVFWADYVRRTGDYDVEMEIIEQAKFHVQGPNSLFVLEKLLGREFRSLKFMRNETVEIAGVETVVLRQGMSGEIGFELQIPPDGAKAVWDAVVEAGQAYGIREMGGRVAMLNHLEANYPTLTLDYMPAVFGPDELPYFEEFVQSDQEFQNYFYAIAGSFESDDVADWYRSPVELGWGNRINFDHRFRGDEALRRELENPRRTNCTLRWSSEDVIDVYASFFREGDLPDFMEMPQDPRGYVYVDKVLKDGLPVGTTSQRGYSTYGREMISHAVIDIELAEPGTEVTVVWGSPGSPQREIRAVTAPAPYKENRSRADLHTLSRAVAAR